MDAAYADKLDGKIPEDFWERKMSDWRMEEQQAKMAVDGLSNAETSDRALDAQRILELANKAYLLYVSQNSTEKAKLLTTPILEVTESEQLSRAFQSVKERKTIRRNAYWTLIEPANRPTLDRL